jgi:hypothetical protein
VVNNHLALNTKHKQQDKQQRVQANLSANERSQGRNDEMQK